MSFETGINVTLDPRDARKGIMAIERDLKRLGTRAQTEGRKATGSFSKMSGAMRMASRAAAGLGIAFGALAFGRLAVSIAKSADRMNVLNQRFKILTGQAGAFDAVLDSAAKMGVGAEAFGNSFARFAIAGEQVGMTTNEVLKLTETVSQLGIIGGASTHEMTAAMIQLGQGLASGQLRGEELRSVMEQMPLVTKALVKGVGVDGVGALRAMAEEGKLTADIVAKALLGAADDAASAFAELPLTFERAQNTLSVEWSKFTVALDNKLRLSETFIFFTETLGDALRSLTGWLDNDLPTTVEASMKEVAALQKKIFEAEEFAVGVKINSVEFSNRLAKNGAFSEGLFSSPDTPTSGTHLSLSDERAGGLEALKKDLSRQMANLKKLQGIAGGNMDASLKEGTSTGLRDKTQVTRVENYIKALEKLKVAQGDSNRALEDELFLVDKVAIATKGLGPLQEKERDAAIARVMATQERAQVEIEAMEKIRDLRLKVKAGDLTADEIAQSEALIKVIWAQAQQEGVLTEALLLRQHAESVANDAVKDAASVLESIRTPLDIYIEKLKEIEKLLAAQLLTQAQATRAVENAKEAYIDADPVLSKVRDGMYGLSDAMTSSFLNAESAGDAFKGWLKSFVDDLLKELNRAIMKKLLFDQVFSQSSGGGGGGGIFGSILQGLGGLFGGFGGGSAAGGTVMTPTATIANGGVMSGGVLSKFAQGGIVSGPTMFPMRNGSGLMGEAGPEAIMPLKRGPGGKLGVAGGGGGGTHITIDARGSNGDAAVEAAVERGIRRAGPALINASVNKVRTERARDPKFFGGRD